jgi:TonB family protein
VCFSSNKRAVRLLVICYFAVGLLSAESAENHAQKTSGDNKKQTTARAVYKPGPDVKAPKLVHYVEPEFSDSSNEAFVDGVVKISTVVSSDGVPTDLRVLSGLNSKEDGTAVEAVKQWRFQPGTKAGEAVNVQVTVEVDFHLL